MTDTPHQPEDPSNTQEMNLEAQLDALLRRLEKVDPATLPADLRKAPAESAAKVPQPNSETESVTEPISETPTPTPDPDAQTAPPDPIVASAKPTQAQDGEKKVISKTSDADLESIAAMADNLIDQQINQTPQAASTPDQQATPQAAQGTDEPSPDDKPPASALSPVQAQADESDKPQASAEPPPPAAPVSLSEDDLANQIESLLNNVKEQGADAVPPAKPDQPAQAAKPEPVAADQPPTASPETPSEVPQPAAVDQAPPQASTTDGTASIKDIDSMLAASAQQAIEQDSGEVETSEPPTQVPGTDELLAAQSKAELQQAAPQPTEVPAEPQTTAPQPAQAPGVTAGATAQDVAAELNEDEQQQPTEPVVAAGDDPQTDAQPAPTDQAQDLTVVIKPGHLRKAERALCHVCGTINKPLGQFSPETRDTVGYVGVVTMAMAIFWIAFGVLF